MEDRGKEQSTAIVPKYSYWKGKGGAWIAGLGWLVLADQGALLEANAPLQGNAVLGSVDSSASSGAARGRRARPSQPLFPEEGAQICSQLCETYTNAVKAVQTLELLAENFFVLWHLIGVQPEWGATELEGRKQAFVLREGEPPVSLAQLVADWSMKRFGSDGISALSQEIGPVERSQLPSFRSTIYSQVPQFFPVCPFGSLGSLGLHQCPLCEERVIGVPKELQGCVLAYSNRGVRVLNMENSDYGIFFKVLRKNWCLDQHLFHQVNLWVNQAPAALQEKVQGSLTAVKMLNWAIEAQEFDITSMPEGPWAELVARYWLIGFEPAVRWIGPGNDYVDGLADSQIDCPPDGGAPDI